MGNRCKRGRLARQINRPEIDQREAEGRGARAVEAMLSTCAQRAGSLRGRARVEATPIAQPSRRMTFGIEERSTLSECNRQNRVRDVLANARLVEAGGLLEVARAPQCLLLSSCPSWGSLALAVRQAEGAGRNG